MIPIRSDTHLDDRPPASTPRLTLSLPGARAMRIGRAAVTMRERGSSEESGTDSTQFSRQANRGRRLGKVGAGARREEQRAKLNLETEVGNKRPTSCQRVQASGV